MIAWKWEGIKQRVMVNVNKERVKHEAVLKEMVDMLTTYLSHYF